MWAALPFVKDVLLNNDNDQNVKPGRDRPTSFDSSDEEKKKGVEHGAESDAKEEEQGEADKEEIPAPAKPVQAH